MVRDGPWLFLRTAMGIQQCTQPAFKMISLPKPTDQLDHGEGKAEVKGADGVCNLFNLQHLPNTIYLLFGSKSQRTPDSSLSHKEGWKVETPGGIR